MAEYGNPNLWQSQPIICKGGLIQNQDMLTQGTEAPGSAVVLQNFENALQGGYRRISGYSKFDLNKVPGTDSNPVLGVKAALNGVFAVRKINTTPSNDIYFSTGTGWTKINTDTRAGNPVKSRIITYAIAGRTVAGVDGVNRAWKYDGTTYTLLNGTGAPTNPSLIEFFNQTIVLAGFSANPSHIIISAPVSDSDFNAADGAAEINVGQIVTGLKVFRNNLYIFCTNSIWKLTGTGTSTYVLAPVTQQIGCLAGDTIQEIGGDLIYLAPDGFRSVAGTANIGDVDLSLQSQAIQPTIANIVSDLTTINCSACVIRKKSQYRCFFNDSSVQKGSAIGVIGKVVQGPPLQGYSYTYTAYEWSTTLGIQPYCLDSYFDGVQERTVMGDPTNGYVYLMEQGNDFDGTPIQAIYNSPFITFKDATLRKVMQKINIYTAFEGLTTLTLGLNYDYGAAGILQPQAFSVSAQGTTAFYGGSKYGTAVYGSVAFPVFKQNLLGSGFTTQFQFTSQGGAPYRVDSYQVTFSQKGRR